VANSLTPRGKPRASYFTPASYCSPVVGWNSEPSNAEPATGWNDFE
jgi:hypothetical protein